MSERDSYQDGPNPESAAAARLMAAYLARFNGDVAKAFELYNYGERSRSLTDPNAAPE